KQSRHESLELRVAELRGASDLRENQFPQEPRGLGDTKLFAEMVDGTDITLQKGIDVRVARPFAEQLLIPDGSRNPVGIGLLVTDEAILVAKVVPQHLPVISRCRRS